MPIKQSQDFPYHSFYDGFHESFHNNFHLSWDCVTNIYFMIRKTLELPKIKCLNSEKKLCVNLHADETPSNRSPI